MTVGFSFGEIALLEKCRRQAGIFCVHDCEFATISKKNESDFDYLIRWEQRQDEAFMSNFDIFYWWMQRKKLKEICHYMEKDKNKIFGDEIYKFGDKVNHIYF